MRQKRAKSYRKQLLVYAHTFKFRQPYQVLVDDQIVLTASDSRFYLVKSLGQTLQAEVKPMITQCCMQALYATENQDAISLAKTYERRRCNHPPKDPKNPLECIESVVNINGENKHRYVVASQNIELRRKLRRIPGVPILHINRAVMVMEPLSDASARISKRKEQEKLYKGLNDAKYAGIKHDEEEKGKNSEKHQSKKRKLGPKQPNPLSMKKKKKNESELPKKEELTTTAAGNDDEGNKKKRKRKHKKKTAELSNDEETTFKIPEGSEE
ncbi:rRNA-processing protein Utp23p [Monosporozyma unispora]|nr:Small subunit processome component [Kazachstania unispora]